MSSIQRTLVGLAFIMVCALAVGWWYKANLINVAAGVLLGAAVGGGLLRLVNWLSQKSPTPPGS